MNKDEGQISDIIDKIPRACFVSIDTEFGGISESTKSIKNLDDYLLAVRADVETYSLFQIGICLAYYNPEASVKWSFDPFNFYTFTTEIESSSLNNSTALWLRGNGFSLDKWIDSGLPFRRLADINDRALENKRRRREFDEVQMVLDAIVLNRKPIVVHYGLYDLLHLYDKLIGSLPLTSREISMEMLRLFQGNLYDTKYIASYLFEKCDVGFCKQTSLPNLIAAVLDEDNMPRYGYIVEHKQCLGYLDETNSKVNDSLFHDAGFDAAVTAMVFVGECESLRIIDGITIEEFFANSFNGALKHVANITNSLYMGESPRGCVYNLNVHINS